MALPPKTASTTMPIAIVNAFLRFIAYTSFVKLSFLTSSPLGS